MNPKEIFNQIARNEKIQALAEEIQDNLEAINLEEFSKENYGKLEDDKLFLKMKKTYSIFPKISSKMEFELKESIFRLKLGVKIIDLGYSIPDEPILLWKDSDFKTNVTKDLIVVGEPTTLWILNVIFGGSWLEEYLAFSYNAESCMLEKKYILNSWNKDKYISPEFKGKVRELTDLVKGRCALHLPIIPIEMEYFKRRGYEFKAISWFRMGIYKDLNSDDSVTQSFRTLSDKFDFIKLIITILRNVLYSKNKIRLTKDGYIVPNDLIIDIYNDLTTKSNVKQWLHLWFDLGKN